jgi:hypothetical protein
MSKVVKLTQNDIETIVTNIVSEQETGGYQLPDGEITYDTPEDEDYSGELEEVDFGDSVGNDFESGEGDPVELALAQGDDGFMYAIDPKTRKVISRIEM